MYPNVVALELDIASFIIISEDKCEKYGAYRKQYVPVAYVNICTIVSIQIVGAL